MNDEAVYRTAPATPGLLIIKCLNREGHQNRLIGSKVTAVRCYYPHMSRDSVSPVCEIFMYLYGVRKVSDGDARKVSDGARNVPEGVR